MYIGETKQLLKKKLKQHTWKCKIKTKLYTALSDHATSTRNFIKFDEMSILCFEKKPQKKKNERSHKDQETL